MIPFRRHLLSLLFLFAAGMFFVGPYAVGRIVDYMRFSGDDYCYSSALKSEGFFRGQIGAFNEVGRFNGDRYSLTLASFTTGLFGPSGYSVAVPAMLLLWLAGLFSVVYQLLRILGVERAWESSIAASAAATFFILLTNADRFSTVYWVSAMYSYFGPLVALVWLTTAILAMLRARRVTWWMPLGLFALAWVFGAFSETGTVVQIVWLFIMTLATWWIERKRFWSRDYKVLLPPLLGSVLALATMLLSPYARLFLLSTSPNAQLWELALRTLRFSAEFYLRPGEGFTTPFMVEVLAFGAMGFLWSRSLDANARRSVSSLVFVFLAIFLAGWILVAVSFSPSYLALHSNPSARAEVPAHIIRNVAYAALSVTAGWYLGTAVRDRPGAFPFAVVATSLALFVTSLYPIRAYPNLLEGERFMMKWAYLWDQRDEQIREAAESRAASVEVMVLDHPIPWVAELGSDPAAAYNLCAQEYYGIPAIIADLPGWDSYDPPG